jgi:hypothetical protein
MALGATVGTETSLLTGASYDIKPTTASAEWIIHNIYVVDGASTSITVEKGNGTTWVLIDTITESMMGLTMHVTYTHYIRLTNLEGSTTYVGYDGMASA